MDEQLYDCSDYPRAEIRLVNSHNVCTSRWEIEAAEQVEIVVAVMEKCGTRELNLIKAILEIGKSDVK